MSPSPRVTGLGGVFFKARDQKVLGDWYRRHLGIDVQDGGWAVFRWRDHEDASRPGSTVWSVFPEDTDYFGAGTQRAMLNYRVDDRVEESPEGRFGWITDPEGNRIELWQPPPGR